jgi:hypothetical protein
MAQANQKSTARSRSTNKQAASSRSRPRSSSSRSGGRSRTSRNGSSANAARARSGSSGRRSPSSGGPVASARDAVASGAQNTKDAVSGGAQSAGEALGSVATKAKGPAVAGGAALAGLVGGMAIATRGGRRKVLGVPVPGTRRPLVKIKSPRRNAVAKDVVKAAGQMGNAGRQMAELATEVRLARQQLDSGRRRSPVEVVLEGLTARRGRAG